MRGAGAWSRGKEAKNSFILGWTLLGGRAEWGRGKEAGHARPAHCPGPVGAGAGLAGDPSRLEPVSAFVRVVPGLELAQPDWPNQGHGGPHAVAQAGAAGVGGAARAPTPFAQPHAPQTNPAPPAPDRSDPWLFEPTAAAANPGVEPAVRGQAAL